MSRTKDGQYQLNIRFNPNNHHQVSRETGAVLYWGRCKSYPDYLKMQESMADHIGIPVEDFDTIRVDFTIDHMDEQTAGRFKKLCDLLIACFTVRHNIGRKHQYRGTTILTQEEKNTKAHHGQYEIEVYNKGIQQESNGALWRLEVRHGVGTQPKAYLPHEHLQLMMEELEALPDFFSEACTTMNRH